MQEKDRRTPSQKLNTKVITSTFREEILTEQERGKLARERVVETFIVIEPEGRISGGG